MYKIVLVYVAKTGLKYSLIFDYKTQSLKALLMKDNVIPYSLTGRLYNVYSLFSRETKTAITDTIKRGMKTFAFDGGYIDFNIIIDGFIADILGYTETLDDGARRLSLVAEIKEFIDTNYRIGD